VKLSKKLAATIVSGVFLAVLASLLIFIIFNYIWIRILAPPIIIGITSFVLWKIIANLTVSKIIYFDDMTQKIASGNLGTNIEVKGSDELSILGSNINALVKNLASAYQSMANSLGSEIKKGRELSQTLKQIEREKARLETLLSSINDGVIGVDRSGKIMLFNMAASKLTGFSSFEAIGASYKSVLRFFHEKDNSPAPDFIWEALSGGSVKRNDQLVMLPKSNQAIPVSQSIGVITDQLGNILGGVVVVRDVTYQRQLDKMKDEFVSVASHELRTPMTAIKGLLSMIFEGDFGQINNDLKDPLKDVATSTERLIELVNDMLDVSRIESGRLKFTITEAPLIEVIREVTSLLEPLANEKSIRLGSDYRGQAIIKADINKVKEILNNLVGNALKFTDTGSITISAELNNNLIYVSVVDTGLGISPEDQKKLFSKFSQISTQELGRPKGTGLGLYISREFARKMGGDLWIAKSQLGQGSTFTFSVPLVPVGNSTHL